MNKLNIQFWFENNLQLIGALIFFIILVGVFLVIFPPVYATTQEEIDIKKESILKLDDKIQSLKIEISDQRIIVRTLYVERNEINYELDIKSRLTTDSWIELEKQQSQIIRLQNITSILPHEIAKFKSLKNEKSAVEENQSQLKNLLEVLENDYFTENSPDVSTYAKRVGVQLSTTCINLIKANYETKCPTYSELVELDTSRTEYSGEFETDDTGYFDRSEPPFENSWRYYDYDNQLRVFIDPPKGMGDRIKLITILPNFDTYKDPADKNVVNYTRIIYHDRWVNDSCTVAKINANNWQFLLNDTIHYMRTDCDPTQTSFDHIEYITIDTVEHDVTTSKQWKFDQWLKEIKQNCIFAYQQCK